MKLYPQRSNTEKLPFCSSRPKPRPSCFFQTFHPAAFCFFVISSSLLRESFSKIKTSQTACKTLFIDKSPSVVSCLIIQSKSSKMYGHTAVLLYFQSPIHQPYFLVQQTFHSQFWWRVIVVKPPSFLMLLAQMILQRPDRQKFRGSEKNPQLTGDLCACQG